MRDIPGFEGMYAATEDGRIYSYKRNIFLSPGGEPGNYMLVNLSKNNKSKSYYVHRLVAMAFIDNPDNLVEVNHKDHVRDNNHVNNLEWVTKYDNLLDRNLGFPIRCIETGIIYPSINKACKELNIRQSNLTNHVNGKLKSVKKLHFEKV